MTYKGIVFDKDGTLIDFNSTWLPTYNFAALEFADNDQNLANQLLESHGYDSVEKRIKGGSLLAGGNNTEIASNWSDMLDDDLSPDLLRQKCDRLHDTFLQQAAVNTVAVPELKTTILDLKQKHLKLGIATSDSYQGIHNTLQAFDVLEQFDFLCGYDSGHGTKPGAGMVLAFCEVMSLHPSQVIVVGDNSHDIEMGLNAGAGLCVGVLTGTSSREELEQLTDTVVDDIRGLLNLTD